MWYGAHCWPTPICNFQYSSFSWLLLSDLWCSNIKYYIKLEFICIHLHIFHLFFNKKVYWIKCFLKIQYILSCHLFQVTWNSQKILFSSFHWLPLMQHVLYISQFSASFILYTYLICTLLENYFLFGTLV